jgi:hypothetical protein
MFFPFVGVVWQQISPFRGYLSSEKDLSVVTPHDL